MVWEFCSNKCDACASPISIDQRDVLKKRIPFILGYRGQRNGPPGEGGPLLRSISKLSVLLLTDSQTEIHFMSEQQRLIRLNADRGTFAQVLIHRELGT